MIIASVVSLVKPLKNARESIFTVVLQKGFVAFKIGIITYKVWNLFKILE